MNRTFTIFLAFVLVVTFALAALIVTVETRISRQEQACASQGMQTIRIRETVLCVRPDGSMVLPPRQPV